MYIKEKVMKKHDFESRKEALLKDIQDVMSDVEELYSKGVEVGSEEGKKAKAKLQEKLEAAKDRLHDFQEEAGDRIRYHADRAREKYDEFEEEAEERFREGKKRLAEFSDEAGDRIKRGARQADAAVHDKPYYAMGFAALAGLGVGGLLYRRSSGKNECRPDMIFRNLVPAAFPYVGQYISDDPKPFRLSVLEQ